MLAAGVVIVALTFLATGWFAGRAVGPRADAPAGESLPGPYAHTMLYALDTIDARPRDDQGILLVQYPTGLHYNPVTVAQHALAFYDRWLALKANVDRSEFLKSADWLVKVQGDSGLWYYDFPNGPMPVPWVSAMAQGQAISVLARAHAITGEDKYLAAARRALATFGRSFEEDGVRMVEDGYVYYEETMPPYSPHILNGMVFAMYGAYDLATISGEERAQEIFDAGVRTLADNIHRYDAGNWSYYNLADPPGLASRFYHGLHVQLLRELWLITGLEVFREYSERFASYTSSPPPDVVR